MKSHSNLDVVVHFYSLRQIKFEPYVVTQPDGPFKTSFATLNIVMSLGKDIYGQAGTSLVMIGTRVFHWLRKD